MPEDPFKAMDLSRREYLSKFGQSVIDSPNSNISDREDALVVKEGLANQRGREAQQQFYDVAPNAREAFLEDNAVISASPQFGQVQGYMGEVRRAGPTYADNVLRKNVASSLPAAYRGRFEELVDSGIGVNEARTQVELEKDDEDLGLDLIDAGIHPDEVEKLRNPETGTIDQKQARWMKAQKSRETTSRSESPAIKAMKEEYDYLADRAQRIVDTRYGGIAPEIGENAAYDTAVADMEALGQQMSAYRRGIFSPPSEEVATPPPGTAPASDAGVEVVAPTVAVDDPRSLREKLAGEAPMFPAPEVKPPLVSGATAPQEYLTRIKSKGISQAERVAAYEQFKNDVEQGNFRPDPNADVGQALVERRNRERLLQEAEKEVEIAPVREEYEAAWQLSKNTLDSTIAQFAKEIGVDKQNVLNSLRDDKSVPTPRAESGSYQPTSPFTPIRSLLAEYLTDKGKGTSNLFKDVEELKPFSQGEFADKLGMGFFSSGAKTWDDVLDAYIDDLKATKPSPVPPAEDLPRPRTPAEAKALPSGTKYLRPDGQVGYVP